MTKNDGLSTEPPGIVAYDEVLDALPTMPLPSGWIWLENSTVCMELLCVCGAACHIDGTFASYLSVIRMACCGRMLASPGDVPLVEVDPATIPADAHVVDATDPWVGVVQEGVGDDDDA